MFKLIQNEHVKLLKRKVTFVSLALIVVFNFSSRSSPKES